jgi:hypothetical protein
MRCSRCAVEMVLADRDAQAVYRAAMTSFQRLIGAPLRVVPRLKIISRRRMSELRQEYGTAVVSIEPPLKGTPTPASGIHSIAEPVAGHHILGFYVQANGKTTIYAEMGLPRALLLGTLAHELGHAWQAERAPSLRDPLRCEGFAEWTAYRVLSSQGHEAIAARAIRRDDIYGQGLRHYLEIEQMRGLPGVLAAAQGADR